MAALLQANTPLAHQLSEILQPKLIDIGWTSGGGDDSALAEYIILMLVNGKDQDQIASELSNDLLNLSPDDPVVRDFARWLFEEIELLAKGGAPAPASEQAATQSIPSIIAQDSASTVPHSSQTVAQDAEMGDAMDSSVDSTM